MRFGLNAGHTLKGPGSGATGKLNESEQTRVVTTELSTLLAANGHTVVNCNIDSASTQNSYLAKVVELANRQDLDYFISIHFNKTIGAKGVEVYTYEGRQFADALETCQNISNLGFVNRGVKAGTGLYVIRKTKAKSMLIEVCFVDDPDASKYIELGAKQIAQAIYQAIIDVDNNTASVPTQNTQIPATPSTDEIVRAGQQHSINFTGSVIAVDGIKGSNTKKNIRKCFQHAINLDYGKNLKVDGYFEELSLEALDDHYVKKSETQYMVTAVEIALMCHGYDVKGVECPGIFGSGLKNAVLQFQKDHNLTQDGIAGVNTIKALMEI